MGRGIRRGRQQSRSHTAFWAQPQTGELTYVALGDSAGVGVGVDDPAQSYVGIVARRLAEQAGVSVRTVNLSASGAKAKDVLDRQLPVLEGMPAPDVITCVVGGNDVTWAPRFHLEEFASGVDAIAARLPRGAVIGSVPSFVHWPHEGRARKANRAIEDAAQRHGHAYADIHGPTSALTLRSYLGTFASDWFHPNAKGHLLWADAVWAQLSER